MFQGSVRRGPFLDADRNLGDALREVNELRRARALPEIPAGAAPLRLLPRPPSTCRWRPRLRVEV